MRQSLLKDFNQIRVLDLHGHSAKSMTTLTGSKDENVFPIQQGVAISILTRVSSNRSDNKITITDLRGSAEQKFSILRESENSPLSFNNVEPQWPLYRFEELDISLFEEYSCGIPINQLLDLTSDGIVTARDALVIGYSKEEVIKKMNKFRDAPGDPEEVCVNIGISTSSANLNPDAAIQFLRRNGEVDEFIIKIQYRPFDYRYLFYHKLFIQSMRSPVTSQLTIPENKLLAVTRQVNRPKYEHAFVSDLMFEKKTVSHDRNTQVFPMKRRIKGSDVENNLEPHIRKTIEEMFRKVLGCNFKMSNLLEYIYAILYSPSYRVNYFQYLKSEYPKIQFTNDDELMKELIELGKELISLHTMTFTSRKDLVIEVKDVLGYGVEKVTFSDETIWVDEKKNRGFIGVCEEIFEFRIGGYRVCEKWLKGRQAKGGKSPSPGIVLSQHDINHFLDVIFAIRETIRVMNNIDEVIHRHGDWPLKGSDEFDFLMEREPGQMELGDF